MEFTYKIYKQLLETISSAGYAFSTFENYDINYVGKCVILRHDVDRIPENALVMANIEYELGICSSYYFRVVPYVWNEDIIKKVVDLGHEVAYHYEDLTIAKGNYQKAIEHFEYQLKRFREFYPSKTICMHGSPMSKFDNRVLWDKYDYRDYGIIAEPYFDVDYNKLFYITDTGRAWNKEEISVRDKVDSSFDIPLKSTKHLIELFETEKLPDRVMINTHPHRWFNPGFGWFRELVLQNLKNVIKIAIVSGTKKNDI